MTNRKAERPIRGHEWVLMYEVCQSHLDHFDFVLSSTFLDIFFIQSQSKPLLVWQRLVPVSRRPLVKDNPPHLPKREVSVGEEVPHLTVSVIDVIKQVPLDRVVLVVSVAVDGGAEVIRNIP